MPRTPRLPIAAAILLTLTGCTSVRTHEQLNATLWVQSAAEYEPLARTAFDRAADHIRQHPSVPGSPPPAVVLDVDETALDNSPYQAELIDRDAAFEPATWSAWVGKASAEPVPGARGFIETARDQGLAVVYITNRDEADKQPTLDNIRRTLDPAATADDLLLKHGREGWGSDKQTRRDYAGERYTIIAWVGDDLNDFTTVYGLGVEERNAIARQHQSRFNEDWFLIPNPMYGSWERAILKDAPDRSRATAIRGKTDALTRP